MNKRQIGTLYEEKAARCLQAAGYEILERNYRCRAGEIDLIAKDHDFLVFVEVKYRENASMGTPLEAVGKQNSRRSATAQPGIWQKKAYPLKPGAASMWWGSVKKTSRLYRMLFKVGGKR